MDLISNLIVPRYVAQHTRQIPLHVSEDKMTTRAAGSTANMNETRSMETQCLARSPSAAQGITSDGETSVAALQLTVAQLEEECAHWRTNYAERERECRAAKEELERKNQDSWCWNKTRRHCLWPYLEARERHGLDRSSDLHTVLDLILTDAVDSFGLRRERSQLQKDLRSLQNQLLSNTLTASVLPDDEFVRMFRSLVSAVRTLSCTVQEPAKMTLDNYRNMDAACELLEGIPVQHWASTQRKRSLLEAATWSILLEGVFAHPFQLFGNTFNHLHDVWQHLFWANDDNMSQTAAHTCELWRYKTAEHLVEMGGKTTITQGSASHAPEGVAASVEAYRTTVRQVLTYRLQKLCTNVNPLQIRRIIDKSFELAMHMALQRSRIRVTYPAVGSSFDTDPLTSQMSSDSDDDGDRDTRRKVVSLVINPGLSKWGDAHGEHYDQRYDIVPPRVLVEPIMPKQDVHADTVHTSTVQECSPSRPDGTVRTHDSGTDNRNPTRIRRLFRIGTRIAYGTRTRRLNRQIPE
jgi:hypothetical protein